MKQLGPTGRSHQRRGSLVIETVIAAIILGAAISMLVPALTAVRRQRQAHRFESLAMVELNNIAEFLPANMTDETAVNLSAWFRNRYPQAQFKSQILSQGENPENAVLQPLRLAISQPAFEAAPPCEVAVVVWRRIQEPQP